ncbi:microcystin dependent MdpB family protein [Thalassotalea insulae]|uniref:Microcystin dependent MdpB family protein n=1 Tax=Thalassotalea insulae TaxID=2056778 RepID=A0ABQ6GW41_9GAMM|nr:tail fiber protein [Thalassotalea insulae]GLX80156.1 microcystin dependent MdpB family protein [Thalassotalea insulae]
MSEPFYGQIQLFGFNYAPRGWAFCNGATLSVSQNTALFSLLGTAYGGDGRTNFKLPNLTSRSPVGFNMGNGPGLETFDLGEMHGQQTHTLTQQQMPSHTHGATFTPVGGSNAAQVQVTTDKGDKSTPDHGDYLAAPSDIPGPDAPEKMFNSSPSSGSLVLLGGVSGGGASAGGTVTVEITGSSQAFSLLNPFTAVNFSIALTGIFPSRN